MGRVARHSLLYEGCYAHIISRSIEKRKVFGCDKGFECFKVLLHKGEEECRFAIHHYCLMHTHFHLVVRIADVRDFTSGMQRIKWEYTRGYNQRHKRRGPLWQNRYKSLLIENEQYLYACGAYVESNPLRAALVSEPEAWRFSSARHYAGLEDDPLVSVYQAQGLPEKIDLESALSFERGIGIGSSLFKFRLRESHRMPVP